ncbi:hypothetical protein TKK_0011186 [Trichogramma kaykai]
MLQAYWNHPLVTTVKLFSDYESVMGKNGEYGTDFEISIFAKLHIDIEANVFREENDEWGNNRIVEAGFSFNKGLKSSLNLLYTGLTRNEGHWELLKEVREDFPDDSYISSESNESENDPQTSIPRNKMLKK